MGLRKSKGGIGFRTLGDFNLALLTKQSWWLIQEPQSLWAHVLKDRYFPHSSFIEAKLRGRFSWIWLSLLDGRDIILKGVHWQDLSGRSIRLWRDVWIPNLPAGHPIPINDSSVDLEQCVNTIINQDEWSCDLSPISNCFSDSDSSVIVSSHFWDSVGLDRLIWRTDRHENYTVKLGYRWI
ncbi:hypothetical protein D8674_005450 [Pyrus ussuriensis x Pyrus communis]|uniref:Uncharacterized protein n=1 Tax=Pyrus ussuriensis x Pyrus communis TaxID=2448454 RepID=A0A5N5FRV1_9ROSA|nr:hypothetical protein D8674_005450 [Pyrus ussuriensis x Pyrus communis]